MLFHYNGHGVPRPTGNGEVWVFNKSYTQYIPLSMYDLQTWVGAPCIYVLDCSAAGLLLPSFQSFAQIPQVPFSSVGSWQRLLTQHLADCSPLDRGSPSEIRLASWTAQQPACCCPPSSSPPRSLRCHSRVLGSRSEATQSLHQHVA